MPVVDSDGVLVTGISVRDLRAVGSGGENFARLFGTVAELREASRREHPKQAGSSAHWSQKLLPRGALYVTPNQTFRDVLNLLNDGNLHRVFVCSTASEDRGLPVPIAVITQTDVIRTVMTALRTLQG
jgi:hypothetical protein